MLSIVGDSYQTALDDARKELANLPRQRRLAADFFDEREAQLKKIIEGLEPLCESAGDQSAAYTGTIFDLIPDYEPGLQEAVEAVIRASSPTPLEPTQVRNALESVGVNTKNYSNAMATIHRALKRLEDNPNSPVTCHVVDGKRLYGWVPKNKPTDNSPEWFKRMREEAAKRGETVITLKSGRLRGLKSVGKVWEEENKKKV